MKVIALGVVISFPVLGLSGVATAAKRGSASWCAAHPKQAAGVAACRDATGKGGSSPTFTIQVDPNLLPETGQSEVYAVIQVEAEPAYAGDPVLVSSSQLAASCEETDYLGEGSTGTTSILVSLDDNGNATVTAQGIQCAPGSDVFEADLAAAPFLTAVTTVAVDPPFVLVPGVYPNPSTSGIVTTGQVETGDTTGAQSDVINVFYVATDPVYAEQTVEIDAPQLDSRCLGGWEWVPGNQAAGGTIANGTGVATAILDNDGNAVFTFFGESCAPGTSVVAADVEAGVRPTYTTNYTIVAPTPTI